MVIGVPERVREVLNDGQRKKLVELLGNPFSIDE